MADDRVNHLVLRDGRKLGYAEYGEPAGLPVFYCHASAGSRLERPADENELLEMGIRFISIDRPGHGWSDFQPSRCLLDWPGDIDQLADHLGIDTFYVMGYSAGGPHALVCAHELPGRVIACAAVSSVAPMGRPGAFKGMPLPNRILSGSARWAPWMTRLIRRMMYRMLVGDVEKAAQRLMSSIPEADKRALYAAENIEIFEKSVRESFRSGWHGVAQDDMVVNQDWGFKVSAIQVQVDIWHGDKDVNVPCHAGEYLHANIPGSRATILSGEGHFFLLRHWGQVLAALIFER